MTNPTEDEKMTTYMAVLVNIDQMNVEGAFKVETKTGIEEEFSSVSLKKADDIYVPPFDDKDKAELPDFSNIVEVLPFTILVTECSPKVAWIRVGGRLIAIRLP